MFWILILSFALYLIACCAIVSIIKNERKINHEKILLKRQIDKMVVESKYSE